ncbi:MAG: type II secretion system protein [Candidatus Omnitrophica bacterium]|nr:type II secretion system protein [Candidatus Omnitrophota bacterium]
MFMRKGFTLIELIMVIVIIGILAAIAVPKFVNLRRDAQMAACEGSLSAIRTALSNYYARFAIDQTAQFPTKLAGTFAVDYLAERTLPGHPQGALWDSYYVPSLVGSVATAYTLSNAPICTDSI